MPDPLWLKGPPQRILLATDLSARCDRALERAIALARAWNATLVVAHVMETPLHDLKSLGDDAAEQERAHLLRGRIEQEIAPLYQGALVVCLAEGEPAQCVLAIAREQACDLIITGIARANSFGRAVLGSTVDRLLRDAQAPVLVVKTRAAKAYDHIALATDFSDSSLHALDAVLRAFPLANVTLFHGFELPIETITRLTDWAEQTIALQAEAAAPFLAKSQALAKHKGKLRIAIERGAPDILLPALGAPLIAAASHGRGAGFERPLGSSARRIVENVPADILIVRDPRAAKS